MCMNSRADMYDFANGTILLPDERKLAQVDAYQSFSPEISNDTLIKLIQDDRAYLPFQRHAFLSKDVWYRRIVWPIHAGCSDTSLQPELSVLDQSISDLKKHCSKVYYKHSLHSYGSRTNAVNCRIESRQMGIRLSLRLLNSGFWKNRFSPRALRQHKCAYFESCRPRRANVNMTSYRWRFGDSGVRMSPSADEYESLGPRLLTCLVRVDHRAHSRR